MRAGVRAGVRAWLRAGVWAGVRAGVRGRGRAGGTAGGTHVVLVGLTPDSLRLRLDAGDAVEDGDRAVEHAQRALHLQGEVDVPWGGDMG